MRAISALDVDDVVRTLNCRRVGEHDVAAARHNRADAPLVQAAEDGLVEGFAGKAPGATHSGLRLVRRGSGVAVAGAAYASRRG